MMQNLTPEGFRLSPQQKYLWTLQQATLDQPYRVIGALLIDGRLNTDELKQSLTEVVIRHEILRTTFHRPPGIKMPFQVVSEDPHFTWTQLDLSDLDSGDKQARVDQHFEAERKHLFEFEQGPLLRASCLRLSDDRHALIVTLPAVCADQRSLWNLAEEISQSLEGRQNKQPVLEQLIQYADFAEWQNGLLEAEDKVAEQASAYWKQQRALIPDSALVLPFETRLQEEGTFDPQSIAFTVESALVEKIERLAQEHQTSAAVVLLACWQALLARLTEQADHVVWVLNDGRKMEDLRTAIGPYARYLPVFCPSGRTFPEYLKQTKSAIAKAEEWQEYCDPLVQAGHALNNEAADIVAFAFQEESTTHAVSSAAVSVSQQLVCNQRFKIKLGFATEGTALRAELEYNSQVFDHDSVGRIAGYYRQLLARVIEDPEREISAIEILDEREKRQLLEINQTSSDFPETRCIHELFEEQAKRTPDAPALVFENQMLSFAELNNRSNQVAHFLRRRGIGPESRVAICMKRSAEIVVGLIGILKAGGAYVPLNPDHPKARLEVQLAESRAALCLSKGSDLGPFENSEVIDLERDLPQLSKEPVVNPETLTKSLNLVYVIFTSGSTGLPKGVAVRHQSLVNYSSFILNKLASEVPLNFATVSTFSADLGNTCIFPSLISGGCLHILSDDTAMEGNLFAEYVADHSIDVVKIVPSHLNALIATTESNLLPGKHLFLGGEALSWDLVKRLSQLEHTCKITNHYGPTETTIGSLTYDIDENNISRYSLTVPIGRPIANTRVYILDHHQRPVPQGVVGELFIGGLGVADGYLNQPTETAVRFLPDPFSSNPDARLYQTGDLVKQLPDGAIEFIGRRDHQVKVRGYRVELAEVEAALEEHGDVGQAVVVVRAEADRDQLVAYLTVSQGKSPSHDDIRRTLIQKLPNYMIPSAFVFLESFPLTANGKLNRAALPSPNDTRPELQRTFVAPQTASEKEIAEIWSSVLKLNEVGIHDDFFELGGHSLLATQVVARVRKAFQLDLPLRSLFESPTIAEFAGRIEEAKDAELSKLLTALEELSDEEAQRLLGMEHARQSREDS